jgi:hypothetical protein
MSTHPNDGSHAPPHLARNAPIDWCVLDDGEPVGRTYEDLVALTPRPALVLVNHRAGAGAST